MFEARRGLEREVRVERNEKSAFSEGGITDSSKKGSTLIEGYFTLIWFTVLL